MYRFLPIGLYSVYAHITFPKRFFRIFYGPFTTTLRSLTLEKLYHQLVWPKTNLTLLIVVFSFGNLFIALNGIFLLESVHSFYEDILINPCHAE